VGASSASAHLHLRLPDQTSGTPKVDQEDAFVDGASPLLASPPPPSPPPFRRVGGRCRIRASGGTRDTIIRIYTW
jgi:hypothetical protein